MNLDIARQCSLALQCLDKIVPICEKAGIRTDTLSSYDEWEVIVEAIFKSFVLIPICDTTGLSTPEDFHRLGFEVTERRKVIGIEHEEDSYFIYDLVKNDSGKMFIEALPLGATKPSHVDRARLLLPGEGMQFLVRESDGHRTLLR